MLKMTRDPVDSPLPLGPAIREEKAAPAPTPTGTPGISRRPDGRLDTSLPLPKGPVATPAPAAPAPAADPFGAPIIFAKEPPTMVVDGVAYREAPEAPGDEYEAECKGCAFDVPRDCLLHRNELAAAAFGGFCAERRVIYIRATPDKEPQ